MIPKSFIPQKKTDKEAKVLLYYRKSLVSKENLADLLLGCDQYLSEEIDYYGANRIARKLEYTKHDLQAFCDKLIEYEDCDNFKWIGLYLSTLVNNIIKEDEAIKLELPCTEKKLAAVGSFFCQGALIIDGDLGDYTAWRMVGGVFKVEGFIGRETGESMTGGKLFAKKIKHISRQYGLGEIYENGKKVK